MTAVTAHPVERSPVEASRQVSETVSLADPRPHVPALDGVRGLAVLLVVALHAMLIVPRAGGIDHAGWQVLRAGWLGVDLFFVLSGFLITGILYDSKSQTAGGFFLNFYARRILRIAPLYYGYLAFYFYVLPRLPGPDLHEYAVDSEIRTLLYLYLYNFYGAANPGMHGPLGVFWSLCVEEHFYLFWPFLVWFLGRRKLMWTCVGMIVFSLLMRGAVIAHLLPWFTVEHAAYLLTPCRLDGLAAGAFVALALRDVEDWRRLMRWAPSVALGTGSLLLGIFMGQRHFRDDVEFHGKNEPGVDSTIVLTLGLTVIAILFAAVVAMTVNAAGNPQHVLQRVFRNSVLRSLGLYSYAIYIFHYLVISVTRRWIRPDEIDVPGGSVGALAARIAAVAVMLAITYVLAFISYHAYEKHFLSLKRFFPPSRKPVGIPAETVETTTVHRPQPGL